MNGFSGWGLGPPPSFPARRRCGGAALLLLEEWLAATTRQSPVVRRRYSPSSEPWLKKSRADNACGAGPRGRAMTPIRGRVEGKAAARQGGASTWCTHRCKVSGLVQGLLRYKNYTNPHTNLAQQRRMPIPQDLRGSHKASRGQFTFEVLLNLHLYLPIHLHT